MVAMLMVLTMMMVMAIYDDDDDDAHDGVSLEDSEARTGGRVPPSSTHLLFTRSCQRHDVDVDDDGDGELMIHFLLKLSCQRHNEDDHNLILMSTMTVYIVFCIRSFL